MRALFPAATVISLGSLGSLALVGCTGDDANPAVAADAGNVVDAGEDAPLEDPNDFATQPKSCVFACVSACKEWGDGGYTCPSLGPWNGIPHVPAACPSWDGAAPPATPTKCTATSASGDAIKYAGVDPDNASQWILPDGRRISAAGSEWIFTEPSIQPNSPVSVLPVPNTTFLLVVDMGYDAHAVRVIDASKIGSGASPMVSFVRFPVPQALNAPIVFAPSGEVFVATDDGNVQALTLDRTTGIIALDNQHSIALPESVNDEGNPANYYVGGLAVSPDGTRLVVTGVFDTKALVYGLGVANYGTLLGSAPIGSGGTFKCAFDPNDPTGQYVYASMEGGTRSSRLTSRTRRPPPRPAPSRSTRTPRGSTSSIRDGSPWGTTSATSSTSSIRTTGTVTAVPVDAVVTLPAVEPLTVAFDATNKILYATLAGVNAVAALERRYDADPGCAHVAGPAADVVVAVGRRRSIPTAPSPISSMRGHSNGAFDTPFPPATGDPMAGVAGGIQLVPFPTASMLATGAQAVATNNAVSALSGEPTVTCPNGENDFPLPPTNDQGPSKQISHVIFIVRENKTFDTILGDFPNVNGDPTLAAKTTSAAMDRLWENFRALVRTFATDDNNYTDAEISNQGHTWTTYGRETDWDERTWPMNGDSRSIGSLPRSRRGRRTSASRLKARCSTRCRQTASLSRSWERPRGSPRRTARTIPLTSRTRGASSRPSGIPTSRRPATWRGAFACSATFRRSRT